MKTIKDFTPEIQSKIPEYIKKYTEGIEDGKRYKNFNLTDAENLIHWNYELCNYKKPVIIVAENPFESQIIFNYIVANKERFLPMLYLIYSLKNNIKENIEKFFVKGSQLDSQLHSQLGSQLRSQLDSQLHSQLGSQLRSQLHSQLHSQLRSQLHSQLGSQLHSQLLSQLGSQLDSQLLSQLRSQLRSQLLFQLHSQYNNDWLFTTNIYSNVLISWFMFIKDEFNIESEIGIKLDSWNDLYLKSNIYSAIFSELVCVVSKYPQKIHRNTDGLLHNLDGNAVEWNSISVETKFDCYYINGRNMPSWIFDKFKNNQLQKEDFLNEENEDIKAGIYELIESKGEGSMLTFLNAIEVDRKTIPHEYGEEEFILYKTKEKFNEEVDLNGNSPSELAWLKMTCPSTGSNYLIPSDASFNDCVTAAKYHRPIFVPEDIPYYWNSRN